MIVNFVYATDSDGEVIQFNKSFVYEGTTRPLDAARAAVRDYLDELTTKTSTRAVDAAGFDWLDAWDDVPERLWAAHGLRPIEVAHVAVDNVGWSPASG